MERREEPQHFVLVHGAGHGAWCWYKLRRLLESSGHMVSCLDLTGAGMDRSDPNSVLSFEDYNRPLLKFMSALPKGEKVILVGHSAGGLSVTHAMHASTDKIKLVIFIAATMLRSGFCSEEDMKDGIPDLSEFGDVYEFDSSLGPDQPPTSVALRKEFQRRLLYHLSPIEDATLASMLLRPAPAAAMTKARFQGDGSRVDEIRRVFIKTSQDRTLKPEQQDAMIRRWPPSEVLVMDTDHSPFFSAPDELFKLILQASASLQRE